jgi:hypothetical protein
MFRNKTRAIEDINISIALAYFGVHPLIAQCKLNDIAAATATFLNIHFIPFQKISVEFLNLALDPVAFLESHQVRRIPYQHNFFKCPGMNILKSGHLFTCTDTCPDDRLFIGMIVRAFRRLFSLKKHMTSFHTGTSIVCCLKSFQPGLQNYLLGL